MNKKIRSISISDNIDTQLMGKQGPRQLIGKMTPSHRDSNHYHCKKCNYETTYDISYVREWERR